MRRLYYLACTGLLLLLSPGTASAQLTLVPDTPIVEIGGQVALIGFQQAGSLPRETNVAGGVRFTFNLNSWFALESEADFYPHDTFLPGFATVQAVFGFKAGVRGRWGGIFGTFRPGLLYHWEELDCGLPEGCDAWGDGHHDWHRDFRSESWFAVNAGAAAELYPSQRFVARLDVGDTFVRRRNGADATGRALYFTSHNLQTSVGMGVRF